MSPELRDAAERHARMREELGRLRELLEARRTLAALRLQYGRPIFLDAPVRWRGRLGAVSGVSGPHLMVTLSDGQEVGPIHPTDDGLVYLIETTGRLEEIPHQDRTRSVGIVQRCLLGGVLSW